MYLHLGLDTVVRSDDIIGIFDIETASISAITREFLSHAQKQDEVINITTELPKAFIICRDSFSLQKKASKVYISQISSTTLLKRAVT